MSEYSIQSVIEQTKFWSPWLRGPPIYWTNYRYPLFFKSDLHVGADEVKWQILYTCKFWLLLVFHHNLLVFSFRISSQTNVDVVDKKTCPFWFVTEGTSKVGIGGRVWNNRIYIEKSVFFFTSLHDGLSLYYTLCSCPVYIFCKIVCVNFFHFLCLF